jgi:hypothetical protein
MMSAKGKRKIDWCPKILDWRQHKESENLIGGRLKKGRGCIHWMGLVKKDLVFWQKYFKNIKIMGLHPSYQISRLSKWTLC